MENINNWMCPHCAHENSSRFLLCQNCGGFRPESEGSRLLRASEEAMQQQAQTSNQIDAAYEKIDFRNKTMFVDKYVRPVPGILTYAEAEQIIQSGLTEELP